VGVKKPPTRPELQARRSDNNKRRLMADPPAELRERLLANANYEGSPKHKRNPFAFGLQPYLGEKGDPTLCDEDAGFTPEQMANIPGLIDRGLRAGLIGENNIIWTVADSGWIFEARCTNVGQTSYHGYPVRFSEAIAELVYSRYAAWALHSGSADEKKAASNCRALYGFRR